MTEPDLQSVRRWFAEELQYVARVRSPAVVQAFATVPRERFAGPGPWRILSPGRGEDYWSTEDADPRRLCHNVLVAIDETRRLNNGQPSLWAQLFDVLGLVAGDHVIHVGAGQGYYSAILAEIVGQTGHVTAIEKIDPVLSTDIAQEPRRRLASGDRRRGGRLRLPRQLGCRRDRRQRGRDASLARMAGRAGSRERPPACSLDGRQLDRRVSADHPQRRRNAPLPGALCDVDGDYSLRRRPRPRGGSATERSAGAIRIRRYPLLAAAPDQPDETCWLAGDGGGYRPRKRRARA